MLNENGERIVLGVASRGYGGRHPPQVKSLKTWLDSVSIRESPKNVGGCKRPAVRPRKVLLTKKTQND